MPHHTDLFPCPDPCPSHDPDALVILALQAYYNRGYAYIEKGEFDLSIEDCTRAIELNPKYEMAYNNRGLAYKSKRMFEEVRDPSPPMSLAASATPAAAAAALLPVAHSVATNPHTTHHAILVSRPKCILSTRRKTSSIRSFSMNVAGTLYVVGRSMPPQSMAAYGLDVLALGPVIIRVWRIGSDLSPYELGFIGSTTLRRFCRLRRAAGRYRPRSAYGGSCTALSPGCI